MFSSKLFKAASVAAVSAVAAFASFDVGTPILDSDLDSATTWKEYKANLNLTTPYYLKGTVVVDSGCTMVIRPGTWIYGLGAGNGAGSRASNLVVAPGGYLDARGTVDSPIVFSAWGDDPREPLAIGPGAKGLWGGIVLMGRANISNPGIVAPEGLDPDPRLVYGKNPRNDADNSGKMKYVSIRHGGTAIASNSEVNGLTMYGVGSGTEIDYVEVYCNYDDGFEWFGGTVNAKHLVASFCNDDAFDLDDGYRGKGQYWFSIKHAYEGDNSGEWDGCQKTQTLYSAPTIYNITLIGSGAMGQKTTKGLFLADSLGGIYRNGIMTGYRAAGFMRASHSMSMPFPYGTTGIGNIAMQGWVVWDFDSSKGNNWKYIVEPDADTVHFKTPTNKCYIADPELRGIGRTGNCYALDPRLAGGSDCYAGIALPPPAGDTWFDATTYVGAFDSTNLWIEKWTALYEDGIVSTSHNSTNKPALIISPATSTRYKKEYALPLQLHFENTSWTPSTATFKWSCKVDGVKVTLPLAFIPTTPGAPARQVYQAYLSPASNLVPGNPAPRRAAPIIGPHVIQITCPMYEGATEKTVLEATSRIWLY